MIDQNAARWLATRRQLQRDTQEGTYEDRSAWLDAYASRLVDLEEMEKRLEAALELLREVAHGEVGYRGGLEHAPRCYAGTSSFHCKCGLSAWLDEFAKLDPAVAGGQG